MLLAACDYNYKFTLIDVGAYGSTNDAAVFSESTFGKSLLQETLNIPKGYANLPGSQSKTPCFFVGDDAFPLSKKLMKPYPGRNLTCQQQIFNYRLSRGRRVIENAFGILTARWRIFRKPIYLNPNTIDKVVTSCVCLHNFLITENERCKPFEQLYCPPNFIDSENQEGRIDFGGWRLNAETSGTRNLTSTRNHNATREAYQQRQLLTDYFLTPEGKVSWQDEYIRRGLNK